MGSVNIEGYLHLLARKREKIKNKLYEQKIKLGRYHMMKDKISFDKSQGLFSELPPIKLPAIGEVNRKKAAEEYSKRTRAILKLLDERMIHYYNEQLTIEINPALFYLKTYYPNITYIPKLYFNFMQWEIFLHCGGNYDSFELIKRKILIHMIQKEKVIYGKVHNGGPTFTFKPEHIILGDCASTKGLIKLLDFLEAHPTIKREQIMFTDLFIDSQCYE